MKITSKAIVCTSLLLMTACGQKMPPGEHVYLPEAPQPLLQQTMAPLVQTESTETIQNQVIVKYKSGFKTQSISSIGAKILDVFNDNDGPQLHQLPKGVSLSSALNSYQSNPNVEFAIPNVRFRVKMSLLDKVKNKVKSWFSDDDEVTTSDTLEPTPTEPTSTPTPEATPEATPTPEATAAPVSFANVDDPLSQDQWYLETLNMPTIWETYGSGNPEVTVAVLDTGVDYDHPDLQGKVLKGPDYVDKDYDPKDLHGHGTHVAGIIAAKLNNQEGITGVAPNVKILAIRVLDEDGSGSLFGIAKGIAYAANKGAKVINLSLGSPPGGAMMRTLANFIARYAEAKGSLIIAAAGNEGGPLGYPAAASHFLSVGATNDKNNLASFSNRGKELDVVAPGVNIMSTFPTYPVTANELGLPQNYASLNGTSMATPIVSAQAALLWSKTPYLKPSEVREKIESTATDLGAIGIDEMYGRGLVNISAALNS